MKTAQTMARTAREMFYFVDDVQRMLGYSRSKSYSSSTTSWRRRARWPLRAGSTRNTLMPALASRAKGAAI